jgi:hypothetical protein
MVIRITPAVPDTPKELPNARHSTAGSKNAISIKLLGVMRRRPMATN